MSLRICETWFLETFGFRSRHYCVSVDSLSGLDPEVSPRPVLLERDISTNDPTPEPQVIHSPPPPPVSSSHLPSSHLPLFDSSSSQSTSSPPSSPPPPFSPLEISNGLRHRGHRD